MSIPDGHGACLLWYNMRMQTTDEMELDFPPIPPPPPMTDEQRETAEASIAAAIACELEKREKSMAHALARRSRLRDCRAEMECCECADMAGRSMLRRMPRSEVGMAAPSGIMIDELPDGKPRPPDLHAANLSFAARVIIWVRDRFSNNAPAVYKAAYLSRKTYSAIISDENHVVSKRTAVQLAFALRLTRAEADLLLHAAGYHLSRSVVEDMIFDACLEAKIYRLEDVNSLLIAHDRRPFVPQC